MISTLITDQPRPAVAMANTWMQGGMSGDLSPLVGTKQLIIKQRFEPVEAIFEFETGNKYEVFDNNKQRLFFAEETPCCCSLCLCHRLNCLAGCRKLFCIGCERQFGIFVYNLEGKKIMHIDRRAGCAACCCPCCLPTITVNCPTDERIATIRQKWTLCVPLFEIIKPDGEVMLRVNGPCFTCSCFGDVEFPITTSSGEIELGLITKNVFGIATELLTDVDNFTITFPVELDANMKATLMAATFLIDLMYFGTISTG